MTGEQVKAQLKTQLAVVQVIAETAREAGPMGAPEGPIYAALMEFLPAITPEYFDACVGHLVRAGLVARSGHLLTFLAGAKS